MTKPSQLTFFTELEKEPLGALFSKAGVVDQLVALQAGVSMGILDFSHELASVVRRLNENGVPPIAWQLLPKDQGYWYHLNSADYAVGHYERFRNWSIEQNLRWGPIGIDIEPDINEFQELLRYNFRTLSVFADKTHLEKKAE